MTEVMSKNHVRIQFIHAALILARTFCYLAPRDFYRRSRRIECARHAYNAATHFMLKAKMNGVRRFSAKLEEVKFALEALKSR